MKIATGWIKNPFGFKGYNIPDKLAIEILNANWDATHEQWIDIRKNGAGEYIPNFIFWCSFSLTSHPDYIFYVDISIVIEIKKNIATLKYIDNITINISHNNVNEKNYYYGYGEDFSDDMYKAIIEKATREVENYVNEENKFYDVE